MGVMKLLGESLQLNESFVAVIEQFVCHIYRMPGEVDINGVRYKMFGRDKTPDANQLPATRDELLQHIKRSNTRGAQLGPVCTSTYTRFDFRF